MNYILHAHIICVLNMFRHHINMFTLQLLALTIYCSMNAQFQPIQWSAFEKQKAYGNSVHA